MIPNNQVFCVVGNLHLNKTAAIERYNRPYLTREEMNKDIITVLNGFDVAYVLGGFGVGRELDDIIKNIKPHINLIPAACDDVNRFKKMDKVSVLPSIFTYSGGTTIANKIVMCAYPMLDWPGKRNGSCLIFGSPSEVVPSNSICVAWPDKINLFTGV